MKSLVLAIVFALPNLVYNVCYPQTKSLIPAFQAISTPDFGYLPTYVAQGEGLFHRRKARSQNYRGKLAGLGTSADRERGAIRCCRPVDNRRSARRAVESDLFQL